MPVDDVSLSGRYRDQAPGVYAEHVFPPGEVRLLTGVPAFLGAATPRNGDAQEPPKPQILTLWPQFAQYFEASAAEGYLADAVRGFFANGGEVCYVLPLQGSNPMAALAQGLERLASLDRIDLVCAPDIMQSMRRGVRPTLATVQEMQWALLAHCEDCGDRLALLDALPNATVDEVCRQRADLRGGGWSGANGALYYPWLEIARPGATTGQYVPPCGHVAGVYARSDRRVGVHKAPANEIVEEAIDVQMRLTDVHNGILQTQQVNGIRAFPGRGIRLWGARTLSADPAWMYVNVRRLFLTVGRWIERALADVVFEPHDTLLWARIERELRAYCTALFHAGALKGATADEAFFVQCDATTNPPALRAAGMVVTELGLAPALPNEFVVVRLIQEVSGVTLTTPEPAP